MRRRIAVAMLGLALLGVAAGCAAPGVACPAIGWINTVHVDASAFGSDIFVQLCVEAGCSAAPGEEPTVSSDLGAPLGMGDGEYGVGMTTPDDATVRIYDAADTLIDESIHEVNWTTPTGVCGGASSAETITATP